ncbi:MAG: aminotransferase [Proteobacteria bacterium]|nr:aminotransferase [Pseudomonadota bacterium]MDA1308150.1 aminotransferase [Pseudomonadota bacterium]
MSLSVNPDVIRAIDPPIAEAQSWIVGRDFTPENPLLDMAQAVPSYPPAEILRDHLASRVAKFETAQYTPIAGIAPLRSALAGHMSQVYGGVIGPENVLISAGCNQAYCLAILALARAGDEVILPVPYYFNHMMWLQMQGISAVALPFRADRGGIPDPEEAAGLITERTRAIVLVTPNNPTGAVYPPETIAAFRDLAAERGIALIIDETYKDFLDDGPPHALFRDERWGETVVQLYSFSKAFSLTGYRVGSVIAGEKVIGAVTKIMDTVSICAARIAQDAALFGLENLSAWVTDKRGMINARRDAVREIFRANDLGYELISSGAYFAYLQHPFSGAPARDVARRLVDEHNILCLPGSFFGSNQEQCLRLAYANATVEEMPVLADRLRASL